jgi:hypothetical protein
MPNGNRPSSKMDLGHLRRETRTALAASAPAIALGPATADHAREALAAWHAWSSRRKKRA